MRLYIAYGSNLNRAQMARRCPDAISITDMILEGYELVFRGNSRGNGVLTIEENDKASIPVGIWAISDKDEESLDAYEGYPWLYRKEKMPVEYRGRTYNAIIYIMNEGHEIVPPHRYYLGAVLDGYKDFGFDPRPLEDAALNACGLFYNSHTARASSRT